MARWKEARSGPLAFSLPNNFILLLVPEIDMFKHPGSNSSAFTSGFRAHFGGRHSRRPPTFIEFLYLFASISLEFL